MYPFSQRFTYQLFWPVGKKGDFIYQTTPYNITSDFIIEQLDRFSFAIKKQTVIVLDNAKVHQSKKMKAMQQIWARRKLFIFFLPPYSPHLNIIERLWRELKTRWLRPQDYSTTDQLFYAVKLILNAVGKTLFINFKTKLINANYL
jgi:transposase